MPRVSKRCFPELKQLFDHYVATQKEEFGILEDEVENVTLLLKPIGLQIGNAIRRTASTSDIN